MITKTRPKQLSIDELWSIKLITDNKVTYDETKLNVIQRRRLDDYLRSLGYN